MSQQKYAIRVKGCAGIDWAARFEEVEILPLENEGYLLLGIVPDQPALHGLLGRIRAASLVLISVRLTPIEHIL